MNKNLNDKGITLIALLVTMIILIILFGVIVGIAEEDGLIGKADRAANIYTDASERESDIFSGVTDLLSKEKDEQLLETLKSSLMSNPEAYRHPDQSKTNKDRAIGTDGKPVNLDLWDYTYYEDGVYFGGCAWSGEYRSAYGGTITEDGRIDGSVPMFFVLDGRDGIYPLVNMCNAFVNVKNLKIAPEIPKTVKYMSYAFYGCESLSSVGEFPEGLESLGWAFYNCKSLQSVPDIPNGVVGLGVAFAGCSSLLVPPKLPEELEYGNGTFQGCISLKEFPVIPSKVTDMDGMFEGCENVSGVLTIMSSKINRNTQYSDPFVGCLQDITVRVPFNSNTYHSLLKHTSKYSNIHIETF